MAFNKEVIEIIPPKDVFVGNIDAQVTLMEFGEYESEVCAKANEIVVKLLEEYDGKIRFNFRHFPLTKIHQRSMKAAESAVAAAQEGKFWEMHTILFQKRRNLGTTTLKLHSKEAGVNRKNFLDELVNSTYGWNIMDDIATGKQMGVTEIPAFFVNGEMVAKYSYETISKAIDEALKKVKPLKAKKTVAPKAEEAEEIVTDPV